MLEYGIDTTFSRNTCVFQDPSHKRIGLGLVRGRLVHLVDGNTDSFVAICTVSGNDNSSFIFPESAL